MSLYSGIVFPSRVISQSLINPASIKPAPLWLNLRISFMRNSKLSSSTHHSLLSLYTKCLMSVMVYRIPYVSSPQVSWPGNVLHLKSIFIIIIYRHIIHCQCLRISFHRLSLYWLAFTGTLNPPTHSHSSVILCGIIIIIIINKPGNWCYPVFIYFVLEWLLSPSCWH